MYSIITPEKTARLRRSYIGNYLMTLYEITKNSPQLGVALLGKLIGVLVVVLVLGSAVPVIWPMITATSDNITAMTGTDSGTTFIQDFWPLVILLIGIGLAVGLIMFAIRRFKA